jgi:hypothetical protein
LTGSTYKTKISLSFTESNCIGYITLFFMKAEMIKAKNALTKNVDLIK